MMNITMTEAIHLILEFNSSPIGFWSDIPIEDPLVIRFIEAGYTSLNDSTPPKYVLNNKGNAFLKEYIDQIANDFIQFLKPKHFECFNTEGINWFSDTYCLDIETAASLYDYITFILSHYGYVRSGFHQTTNGSGYEFILK